MTSKRLLFPPVLKVGHHIFEICEHDREWAESERIFGQMVPDALQIHVATEYPASIVLDTFIHEVLHAIAYAFAINSGDEEQVVSQAAPALAGILLDNPKLLGCINKLLTKIKKGY